MVAPIHGAMSVAQAEQARSMIRMLKQYLRERGNAKARHVLALAIASLAEDLVSLPDAGAPTYPKPPPRNPHRPPEPWPDIPQPPPETRR